MLLIAYGTRPEYIKIKPLIDELEGKIPFNKPVSCHLYPIRVSKFSTFESLNYDRWPICNPACSLGEQLKVPIYKFLKEPITIAYGDEFYKELEKVDEQIKNVENLDKK